MLQIGAYKLPSRVVLAPMAGVTDRPFRQLCKRYGAGLTVSEMLSSDTALYHSRKSRQRLNFDGESAPRCVQIVGNDPQQMALAASINAENGADIIDINMGCPAKKVCRKAAGSALLRDEALVQDILQQVVQAVDIPVTLKIRTGWSPEQRNALRIAELAQDCGIAALTIHGRTRACGFSGRAEYDSIAAVKQQCRIPVIANGDIDSPLQAAAVLAHTGADAVMIGRGAQGQPWLIAQIHHYLQQGQLLPTPALAEIKAVVVEHLRAIHQFYGELMGPRIARKHLRWYIQRIDSSRCDQHLYRIDNAQEQLRATQIFFDNLINREDIAA